MNDKMEQETSGKKNAKWWPHYVLTLSVVMTAVIVAIVALSYKLPVPDDAPAMVPLPDDGENVPGPEWLFLMLWQPFWSFTGMLKKYLFLMPVTPIVIGIILILLPFMGKIPFCKIPGLKGFMAKTSSMKSGFVKSLIYAIPALIFGLAVAGYAVKSGHQAKLLGCDSCHNPAMGHRMAIPPVDVFKYYSVERAMQIDVGKYRAGKIEGVSESGENVYNIQSAEGGYKDANWQMRHMYEPTFTW
jgi:hypothetical protein